MKNAPSSSATDDRPDASPSRTGAAFDSLRDSLKSKGPDAAIQSLIDTLEEARDYRPLLDALLLKARFELGLPPVNAGALSDLPEPVRGRYEEKYVEAIRLVGSRLLAAGDLPAAWTYFRAIGEHEPVADALDRYLPGDDAEKLAQVIDLAFNQGANPRRGFEMILEHYGTCSAITALEQSQIADPKVQMACIGRLVRHLHGQLLANLVADLRQRGESDPPGSASMTDLVKSHPELFAEEAYHTDVSHLSAAVRYSIMASDPTILELASDLAEYGRRLSPRLQFEGAPPFERTFDDHLRYLRALQGQDLDEAIAHFREKAREFSIDDLESSVPAQVLVNLLARVGRLDEAIDEAERLAHFPDAALGCPGVAELCQRSGRLDRLEAISRSAGNLVNFLAAQIGSREPSPSE